MLKLEEFPHLVFWDKLLSEGFFAQISYGIAKYQKRIPESAGVYLFCLFDISYSKELKQPKVVYVGKSRNLFKRHIRHEVEEKIREQMDRDWGLELWFKPMPEEEIRDEEIRLIRFYDPSFNLIHRVKGL